MWITDRLNQFPDKNGFQQYDFWASKLNEKKSDFPWETLFKTHLAKLIEATTITRCLKLYNCSCRVDDTYHCHTLYKLLIGLFRIFHFRKCNNCKETQILPDYCPENLFVDEVSTVQYFSLW